MPAKRSTDGITANKIMFGITAFTVTLSVSIGSFEYIQHLDRSEQDIARIEKTQHKLHENMIAIAASINDLVIAQKIDYAQQMNLASQVRLNENAIRNLRLEMRRLKR